MVQKKKRVYNNPVQRDSKILMIALSILYSIFVYTAFIRSDFFWGINYLYYLPQWEKILFTSLGSIVFLPPVNRLIFNLFQLLSNLIRSISIVLNNKFYLILSLFMAGICFGVLFYIFRVVSLYHDPMGAIFIIKREYSIYEYFIEIGFTYKTILILYLGICKHIFHQWLGFSEYLSLAVPGIITGSLYIILLILLIRELKLSPLHGLFLFILMFTHTIVYFYFGNASSYVLIPLFILLYIYSLVVYFKYSMSILYPLGAGVLAIFVHIGTLFIIPSMVFLVVYKYRHKLERFYGLLIFSPPRRSYILLSGIALVSYLLIVYMGEYMRYLSIVVVQPFEAFEFIETGKKFGWPLFSLGYIVHLLNIFILSSPVGIILFFVVIKYFRRMNMFGEFKYALFWVAAGGLVHIILSTPRTIYAWDDLVWVSGGYILLGGLIFLKFPEGLKTFKYTATIVITHALLYFTAWIALHNNLYASVLNYLDTASKAMPQLVNTLQIMKEDIRDPAETKRTLNAVEKRASTKEDYLWLFEGYYKINDPEGATKMKSIYGRMIREAIQKDPNNAYNYYQILNFTSSVYKRDPAKRDELEPLYKKTIQLEPLNLFYYMLYAEYLYNITDWQNSYSILKKVDSLYITQDISLFETSFNDRELKIRLTILSYNIKNYLETIDYFKEAIALGAGFKVKEFENAFHACLISYTLIGNSAKAEHMLTMAHQNGNALHIKENSFLNGTPKNNIINLSLMKQYLDSADFVSLERLLTYVTEENNDPQIGIFRCVLYIITRELQ